MEGIVWLFLALMFVLVALGATGPMWLRRVPLARSHALFG
jgi:hypothetical protein